MFNQQETQLKTQIYNAAINAKLIARTLRDEPNRVVDRWVTTLQTIYYNGGTIAAKMASSSPYAKNPDPKWLQNLGIKLRSKYGTKELTYTQFLNEMLSFLVNDGTTTR